MQIVEALRFRKVLDGVAEHCARHRAGVKIEEGKKLGEASPLPYFAQHPSGGFVHKVVVVGEEVFCQLQGI